MQELQTEIEKAHKRQHTTEKIHQQELQLVQNQTLAELVEHAQANDSPLQVTMKNHQPITLVKVPQYTIMQPSKRTSIRIMSKHKHNKLTISTERHHRQQWSKMLGQGLPRQLTLDTLVTGALGKEIHQAQETTDVASPPSVCYSYIIVFVNSHNIFA